MKIETPEKLPADPVAAYRLGYTAGMKSAASRNAAKGGAKRAANLTPERRREIAAKASERRWSKKSSENMLASKQ